MKRRVAEKDVQRAVRLLESLREDGLPPTFDVATAVSRRVRLLPVPPRQFTPLVSLAQFGWAAAAAFRTIVVGGIGLAAVLGTSALAAPSALWLAVGRGGSAIIGAATGFARSLVQIVLGIAQSTLGGSAGVDSAVTFAARGALVVCALMVFLTLIVVLYETRTRRIAG